MNQSYEQFVTRCNCCYDCQHPIVWNSRRATLEKQGEKITLSYDGYIILTYINRDALIITNTNKVDEHIWTRALWNIFNNWLPPGMFVVPTTTHLSAIKSFRNKINVYLANVDKPILFTGKPMLFIDRP